MVTVNTMPGSDADGVAFMSKKRYHFTNLSAPSEDWATAYGFQAAPTTVLLDGEGREILRHVGFSPTTLAVVDEAIGRLLKR